VEDRVARPQTLMLMLLGGHVHGRRIAVSAATFIVILGNLGVSVDAARSTLTRMVRRGYLVRHRRGRQVFFSLTERAERLLSEGEMRFFEQPPHHGEGEHWTLLSFTMPEERRRERHSLRSALSWRGFGLLRNGLWLAPGSVDVTGMIDDLELHGAVAVFVGCPAHPTDIAAVVSEAWDLDGLRAAYDRFVERWGPGTPAEVEGDLAAQVQLLVEWRHLQLLDPGLPLRHLPGDWPAPAAHRLFLERYTEVQAGADREFFDLLEMIELD
jgi:phenylacetic acid degradation operon negative regulatory protein